MRSCVGHLLEQGGGVVRAAMDFAADEEGRGAEDLAGREAAVDVAANPREYAGARPVGVEAFEVEPELRGVATQVRVLQRLLAMEQRPVHVPEASLTVGGLRGGRRGERMRVDLGEREVAEREPRAIPELRLDALDRAERLP